MDDERTQGMRNLKILGLVLAAVLAMSAVAASAASANKNYWFQSDAPAGATTKLTGEQKEENGDRFVVDGGTVRCQKTHYTGDQTGPTATTLTLTASYTGCKFGSFEATVNMGNCHYQIHTDTNGNTTNGSFDTISTITCSSGDITVTVTSVGTIKCILHVPAQTLGTGIVATNATLPNNTKDVTAHIDFSTITYTQTGGTGLGACPNLGTTHTSNGLYEGEATLTGFNSNGGETDISVG
jgi:hypothetical protein